MESTWYTKWLGTSSASLGSVGSVGSVDGQLASDRLKMTSHNRHNQTWSQQIQICSKIVQMCSNMIKYVQIMQWKRRRKQQGVESRSSEWPLPWCFWSRQWNSSLLEPYPRPGTTKVIKVAVGKLWVICCWLKSVKTCQDSISGTVSHKGFCFFDFWIRASFGWELEHQKTKNCFSSS